MTDRSTSIGNARRRKFSTRVTLDRRQRRGQRRRYARHFARHRRAYLALLVANRRYLATNPVLDIAGGSS